MTPWFFNAGGDEYFVLSETYFESITYGYSHSPALQDVAACLALEPRHFGAWSGKGLTHMRLKQFSEVTFCCLPISEGFWLVKDGEEPPHERRTKVGPCGAADTAVLWPGCGLFRDGVGHQSLDGTSLLRLPPSLSFARTPHLIFKS